MFNQSILLSLLLNSAPQPPTEIEAPDFADQLDYVDVTVSDEDAVVVAFDDAGEAIGSLSIWIDDRGVTWMAADYADGYSLISVDPLTDEVTREGDLEDAELAERSAALLVYLEPPAPQAGKDKGPKPKHSWMKCGLAAGVAAWKCHKAPINPLGCVGGMGAAACACVPKIVKEFEGYKCPGL